MVFVYKNGKRFLHYYKMLDGSEPVEVVGLVADLYGAVDVVNFLQDGRLGVKGEFLVSGGNALHGCNDDGGSNSADFIP